MEKALKLVTYDAVESAIAILMLVFIPEGFSGVATASTTNFIEMLPFRIPMEDAAKQQPLICYNQESVEYFSPRYYFLEVYCPFGVAV